MRGLILGADQQVAAWAFQTHGICPTAWQRAIGILDHDGHIVGSVLFENYNGANIDLSYYGKSTMTLGIVRALARIAITQFDPSRVTICIHKQDKSLARALMRSSLGFRLEGAQRCYYGKADTNANTALRFVMFRDQIERIAKGLTQPNAS